MSQFKNNFINRFFPASIPYIASYRAAWYLLKCSSYTTGFIANKHTKWIDTHAKSDYSITRNLDDPANDFSILQALGCDPKYVNIHKNIVLDDEDKLKKSISWTYGTMNYYESVDVNKIKLKNVKEFMLTCINTTGVTYAVFPVVVDNSKTAGREYITVTEQLILTNLINPQELLNKINVGFDKLMHRYNQKDLKGKIVFKYRAISYSKYIYEKILNIPVKDVIRKHTPLKVLDLKSLSLIPLSINLNKYGKIINNQFIYNGVKQSGTHYLYKKDNGVIIFVHDSKIKGQRKLTVFKNTVKEFECIDVFDEKKDVFTRKIGDNHTFFISNSKKNILYTETVIESKPILKGKVDSVKDNKISSFDIETYLDCNNIFTPYACAFARYDDVVKTYYLTDFNDQRDMLKNCILDMLRSDLGTVYVHNLSKFDSYFMHDILKNDEVIVGDYKINKDRKILSIKVKFQNGKEKGSFIFRDSLLLLPSELRILTKKFETDNDKLYFPHRFVKKDNLNYTGVKPDFEYYDYDKDDKDEYLKLQEYYNEIKSDNWNLRDELLNYLKNDVKGLQQVVKKFSDDIWKLENLNVTNISTCSSLAFKSLKCNYLDSNMLYQVKGGTHQNMREAFFGGVSEVYNLKADNGVKIYDINSSYPASMKQDMPIGKPVFSTDPGGLDNYFGVVYAKIESPKSSKNYYEKLDYPPLPFRLPNGGIINPIGNWTGWYSSELLKYVRDVWGYKINVEYGYKFSKGEGIFNEFVDKYYRIKAGLDKDLNINRDTSKLMLNSCFGRTGMKLDDVEIKFVTSKVSKELQMKYQVIDIIQLTPEIDWIKYRRQLNDSFIWSTLEEEKNKDGSALRLKENDSKHDIEQSLPIAIFTTAYSTIRLFEGIRKVKESGGVVYAVDTDSIHTDGYLPEDCIGKDLGLWKLEFEGTRGLYPLPKIYLVEGKVDEKSEVKEIKKGKGVKRRSITREEYEKLSQGENIDKEEYRFKIIKKEFRIKLEKTKISLSAELNKRIPDKNRSTTKPLLVINGDVKYNKVKISADPNKEFRVKEVGKSFKNNDRDEPKRTTKTGRDVPSTINDNNLSDIIIDRDHILSNDDIKAIYLDELNTIDLKELYSIDLDFNSDFPTEEIDDLSEYNTHQNSFIDWNLELPPSLHTSDDIKESDLKWLLKFDDHDQAEEIKAIENEELKIFKTMNLNDYLNKTVKPF